MKKPPLLLLHGICNNANLFAAPYGLGMYLSEHFAIYPVSYPVKEHRNESWDFDFHLEHDMPLIWRHICDKTGEKPCVFGYSMGGMLAMASQATGVIDAPAVVTAASPFSFGMIPLYPPLMRTWVRISALTGYRTVPIRLLGRILCSLMAATVPSTSAFDLNLFRELIKTACVNVPVETFLQALTWAKTRKFTDRTGTVDYLQKFSQITAPVCLIYGSHDRVAPSETVEVGYHAVNAKSKALVRIPEGTHINMTAGDNASKIAAITRAWCCHDSSERDELLCQVARVDCLKKSAVME